MCGGQFHVIYHTVFCPPEPRLDALFTGKRERSTHSCITAVKWDAYDVENTAGNARRLQSGFISLSSR